MNSDPIGRNPFDDVEDNTNKVTKASSETLDDGTPIPAVRKKKRKPNKKRRAPVPPNGVSNMSFQNSPYNKCKILFQTLDNTQYLNIPSSVSNSKWSLTSNESDLSYNYYSENDIDFERGDLIRTNELAKLTREIEKLADDTNNNLTNNSKKEPDKVTGEQVQIAPEIIIVNENGNTTVSSDLHKEVNDSCDEVIANKAIEENVKDAKEKDVKDVDVNINANQQNEKVAIDNENIDVKHIDAKVHSPEQYEERKENENVNIGVEVSASNPHVVRINSNDDSDVVNVEKDESRKYEINDKNAESEYDCTKSSVIEIYNTKYILTSENNLKSLNDSDNELKSESSMHNLCISDSGEELGKDNSHTCETMFSGTLGLNDNVDGKNNHIDDSLCNETSIDDKDESLNSLHNSISYKERRSIFLLSTVDGKDNPRKLHSVETKIQLYEGGAAPEEDENVSGTSFKMRKNILTKETLLGSNDV